MKEQKGRFSILYKKCFRLKKNLNITFELQKKIIFNIHHIIATFTECGGFFLLMGIFFKYKTKNSMKAFYLVMNGEV